jgi:hypothetical protein
MVEFTLRFDILSEAKPLEERIVVEVEAIEDEILTGLVTRLETPAGPFAQIADEVSRLLAERLTTTAHNLLNRLDMIHTRFLVDKVF